MNHAQSAKFETKVRFRKRSFTSWKKNAQSVNTIHLYSNNNYNLSSSSSAIYPICILSRPLCFITQRILHRSLRAGSHDACFLPTGRFETSREKVCRRSGTRPLAGSRCSRPYRKRSCRSANNYIAPRQNTWPDERWPQSSWKVSLQILVTFTSCSKLLHDLSWKF